MTTVPLDSYTIEALTPDVVSSLLGRAIVDVRSSPVGTGQLAHSYRLQLEYAAGEDGPATVVVKLPSTDEASRQMALGTSAYVREVRFYQEMAGSVATRTPACHHASIADGGMDFVLVLEDLGTPAQVNQLTGCTPDQAAVALSQAAAFHGPSWRSPRLQAPWLPVKHVWGALGAQVPAATAPFLDRFAEHLSGEQAGVVEHLGSHVPAWLDTLDDHRSLWHGDFRLDNLLFDGQDADGGSVPLTVVDWQSVAAAPGVIDVSYFLGTSLDAAVRTTEERDLVTHYHQELLAHGVSDYSVDECWTEYRAHAIYGLVLTVPVALGVERSERGDAMFGAMARRVADQILALDTYHALAEVARR